MTDHAISSRVAMKPRDALATALGMTAAPLSTAVRSVFTQGLGAPWASE